MITIFKTNSMKNAADYVMQRLAQVDKTNLSVMHTVIVPDRASLEAERALLKAVGGSFNIQVRTFRRLAGEILPKYDYLSKQAGIMALTGIVQDKKNQLVCYTKGVAAGFVSDMYDTISMMKYCKISPEMLQNADLPKALQGKIHDIALLYGAYMDFTRDKFIDSADKLDLLCQNMSQSQTVTNGYFYLYDFDNFSAQELALVEQLSKCSLGVTVACCYSENKNVRYLYLNDIFDSVMNMCKKRGLEYYVVPEGAAFKTYGNKFTRQIGEHLFRYDDVTPIESEGFAETYVGASRVQEVYALACRVQKYVRSGGRFRDVYVVTSDINKYANAIATVFPEFNIEYFCDSQYCLVNHPYARFVLDYLDLCRNNGKLNYVLSFVKNYLYSGLDGTDTVRMDEDVFMFENYCLKYNVSYNYKKKFKLCQDGKKNRDELERADAFRAKFNKLYEAMPFPTTATAKQYVEKVRKFIEYSNLNQKNDSYAQKQIAAGMQYDGKITKQVQRKFEEVLQQAEIVMGDRVLKLEEFAKLLTITVTSLNMSVIPVSNDCVVFANMAKARKHDIKFLALLGANFGAMPIVKSDGKLLSDKNMDVLNNLFARDSATLGVQSLQPQIEPKILSENRRERFSLFQLLLEPEEKLYVSSVEKDGVSNMPVSQFVTELQKMFMSNGKPLLPTSEADEDVYTENQALAKLVANTRRLRDNQMVKMPSYNVLMEQFGDKVKRYEYDKCGKEGLACGQQLFLDRTRTSISQLTEFYKCPYSFFFKYGLHVKPREVAQLKAVDFGNILHDTLDKFVRGTGKNDNDETVRINAEKCFTDAISADIYAGITKDAQFHGALMLLKREAVRMCSVVKKQLENSEFYNYGTEITYAEGAALPPVEVDFGTGKFYLTGKIDRVDMCGEKFIVVDYKSGTSAAHYDETELYTGQKMQLLVYMKAVMNSDTKLVPVGYYYFALHDDFADVGKAADVPKVFTYVGRTLDDVEIACKIDKLLKETESSEKLTLKLKKGGEDFNKNVARKKVISQQQIYNQVEYAMRMIKQAGRLMQQGYIAVSPYKNSCSKCDYRYVCDFNDVLVYDERNVSKAVQATQIDKAVEE